MSVAAVVIAVKRPAPTRESDLVAELEAIRERVRRNEPRHRDPEAFHIEKSEITGRLSRVINALTSGRPLRKG